MNASKIFAYMYLLLLVGSAYAQNQEHMVDMVIFSYDRPLQLYALLESTAQYVTGQGEVHVIYRASNDEYDAGYHIVQKDFPGASYHKQGANPRQDFKPLTLNATFNSPHAYVVFAVDDIIVKDYFDLRDCAALLAETDAYGFYLRLGKNITQHYVLGGAQPVPPLTHVMGNVYMWQLSQATKYWGYPNTVDMTVYRKADIEAVLRSMSYYHPNTLEGHWAGRAGAVRNRKGLCFEQSTVVNIPDNRVQDTYHNKFMGGSPQELLAVFNKGLKIDIQPLFQINNTSAHMEYNFTYVER